MSKNDDLLSEGFLIIDNGSELPEKLSWAGQLRIETDTGIRIS